MKSLLRRSSNIELLRILLMTSIVFWHLLVHGIGLIHQDFYHDVDSYKVFLYCLAPFFSFAVNCFFFISGFYGIKLTLNKFLSFLVQAFIYTLFTSFVINITTGEYSFRMLWSIVSNSFPFASNGLWFLVAYIYLMMLSPVFNYGFDAINNKEKKQKVIRSILFCLFVCLFRLPLVRRI